MSIHRACWSSLGHRGDAVLLGVEATDDLRERGLEAGADAFEARALALHARGVVVALGVERGDLVLDGLDLLLARRDEVARGGDRLLELAQDLALVVLEALREVLVRRVHRADELIEAGDDLLGGGVARLEG